MTTLNYDGLDTIQQQLTYIQLRRRFLRIVAATLAVATVLLASLLVALPLAGLWPAQPPAWLRWSLLAGLAAIWMAAIGWFILRALLWRQNPAQTARFIEQALPELRNDLINSVLLPRDAQVDPGLLDMAVREAAIRTQRVDVNRGISPAAVKRWSIAAVAALLLLGLATAAFPHVMARGLAAIFTPQQYLPQVGSVRILTVTPGDATAFVGEKLQVLATFHDDPDHPVPGEILIEGEDQPRPMFAQGPGLYAFTFDAVDRPFRYAVRIGDSRWPLDKPWYTVRVAQHVNVEALQITYTYPAYTHLPPQTVTSPDGLVEAPAGTLATIKVQLSQAVPAAILDVQGAPPRPMAIAPDRSLQQNLPVEKDGQYRIELRDRDNRLIQQLPDLGQSPTIAAASTATDQNLARGYYRIHALPDTPPRIEFIAPTADATVAPGKKCPVRIRLTDDYGLDNVRLSMGPENGERPLTDFDAKPLLHKKEAILNYAIVVPKDTPEGSVLIFRVTATDNKPPSGQNSTVFFKIAVQDAARVAADQGARYEQLRARLMALLRLQETQRVSTAVAAGSTDIKAINAKGVEIQQGQRKIRAEMLDVLSTTKFDAQMITAQQALAVLSQNEAVLAIEQSAVVSTLAAPAERDATCQLLGRTQNRIISTLQTLLAVLPAQLQEKSQATSRPGENLAPETREKLSQLKSDLEKFIDAQKKIVQASESLVKKPVDTFTAEDEKLLNDLAAKQDDWAKFLNEKFADFSKLAQQDFSNPVMMKELLSVKSDVTMAKDALAQKSAEIATALEDNGIENAKTLTANIEKWLPDTPDRAKWTMEDPTGGQTNVEQPELPKELEDLVGDLLEQEEDLFSEMEDTTSKYTQSGDKGIGWDAADGPISNMNAQGVTGNQLPNANELGGRSGEGRQGKATGEFVEDKAVGKGGRRTPTRLTAEPFQQGQIKDQSEQAAGGSTGGGKVSGAGADGLEGPVPPPLAKELDRMAGKQASLANKAQRLQTQFQQKNFDSFALRESITLMNRVQDDLKNYRYQNALRGRQTLQSIQSTRLMLEGKLDVTADTAAAMPKYVRDDIADAMKGKLPAQYQDALQQYYRRLGEQGKK